MKNAVEKKSLEGCPTLDSPSGRFFDRSAADLEQD
jgi:hypothetical protein